MSDGNLLLCESPHIDSYKRFLNGFGRNIRSWLTNFCKENQHFRELKDEINVTTNVYGEYVFPDSDEENECRLKNKTLEMPLELTISDSKGYSRSIKIGTLPCITSRGSFITKGVKKAQERFLVALLGKSPNIFFKEYDVEQAHVKEVIFMPEAGYRFIFQRRDNKPVEVIMPNGKSCKLSVFLSILGFSGEDVDKGIFDTAYLDKLDIPAEKKEEIIQNTRKLFIDCKLTTMKKPALSSIKNFAKNMGIRLQTLQEEGDSQDINERFLKEIREKIAKTIVGKVCRAQINRKIKCVTGNLDIESEYIDIKRDFSNIIKAFIAYINSFIATDDPWDLGNLRVSLVGDYLHEAFRQWRKYIERKMTRNVGASGVKDINSLIDLLEGANKNMGRVSHFDRYVSLWLVHSPMSQLVKEESGNALEAASLTRKITFNGGIWGGIAIGHKREPRDIHWSHYGRICPLDTPQSEDVGLTLSLTISSRVNELGIIETPCYKVIHTAEGIRINKEEIVWVSPWDEASGNVWIAFPDQEDLLLRGNCVEAHGGDSILESVEPARVSYIHPSSDGMYGIAANLIPFRRHNDPVRGTMSCSFVKQALPLEIKTAPCVKTGFEKYIPDAFRVSFWTLDDEEMAFGIDLLAGYMPWKGWNFEDALVISDTAANKLTNIRENHITVKIRQSLRNHRRKYQHFKKSKHALAEALGKYDENGCLLAGTTVSGEDSLVIEITHPDPIYHKISEYLDTKDVIGIIVGCENINKGDDSPPHFKFTIRDKRKAEIGDKLANRHGHKGVISKILYDHEMPYFLLSDSSQEMTEKCPCGETRPHRHFEILINPLSIVSRKNLGQLYETLEARDESMRTLPEKVDCYMPDGNGGCTKLTNKVFAGRQYIMKLDHNAADKIHARSRTPDAYNSFVEQPLKGRRLDGGQRLGEMEIWSLMAHNANNILREFVTIKSDNIRGRDILFSSLLSGDYKIRFEYDFPEALKTFAAFCMGLGINVTLQEDGREVFYPFEYKSYPEVVKGVKLSIMNTKDFAEKVSCGEVKLPSNGTKPEGYLYHPEGLESEKIFGPVKSYSCACGEHVRDINAKKSAQKECKTCGTPLLKSIHRRWRFGHIGLAALIPNPFFMNSIKEELQEYIGLTNVEIEQLLKNNRLRAFKRIEDAQAFFISVFVGSSEFRKGLGKVWSEIPVSKNPNKEEAKKVFKFFMNKAKCESKSLLKYINDFFKDIIETEHISGIDLLSDMLSVHKEVSNLNMVNLPVIPPKLRYRFKIPNGKIKAHDLTELYKNVLRANNALKDVLLWKDSMEISEKNEYINRRKRLYISVLQLMCNDKQSFAEKLRDYSIPGNPVRHSLSTHMEGKEGLINGYLLGKRVDFSGRAVIIPDPNLHINECKLPPALILKLFRPLISSRLKAKNMSMPTVIDGRLDCDSETLRIIEDILEENNVLLNRQPTLHRLGMLAFKPLIGEGSVIAISPLVTAGFNADFDGDQMAVFLPLTDDAKKEVASLYPSENKWHPADGSLALSLAQDISLGVYLATGKSKKEIKKEFEDSSRTDDVVENLITLSRSAFNKVTGEGISFSLDELLNISRAFNASCKTGVNDTEALYAAVKNNSPVLHAFIESGARGTWEDMMHLTGKISEKGDSSNLALGLTVGEQMEAARVARINLVDTKLGTAEAGALTKHLVSLGQALWIDRQDCGTSDGIEISTKKMESNRDMILYSLYGKVLAADFREYKRGYFIGYSDAEAMTQTLLDLEESIFVRSPLYCKSKNGVCQTCYGVFPPKGKNLNKWTVGEFPPTETRVGIIAASAVSEPGTQMALRKKHTTEQPQASIKEIKYSFQYNVFSPAFQLRDFPNYAAAEKVSRELHKLFPDIKFLKIENSDDDTTDIEIILKKLNKLIDKRDFYDKHFAGIMQESYIEENAELKMLCKNTEQYRRISAHKINLGNHFNIQMFNRRLLEKYFPDYIYRLNLWDRVESELLKVEKNYRNMGHSVLSTHFEVIFKGIYDTLCKQDGWISSASYPDIFTDIDTLRVIATSAFNSKTDNLNGLKERTLIGKHLPSIKEQNI